MSKDLTNKLRKLGDYGYGASRSAHGYFTHTGGRVSLSSASEFYDQAVQLAREAADAIETLQPKPPAERPE